MKIYFCLTLDRLEKIIVTMGFTMNELMRTIPINRRVAEPLDVAKRDVLADAHLWFDRQINKTDKRTCEKICGIISSSIPKQNVSGLRDFIIKRTDCDINQIAIILIEFKTAAMAKRYHGDICILSEASAETLKQEGGLLSEDQRSKFAEHPRFQDVMSLREADDAGKDVNFNYDRYGGRHAMLLRATVDTMKCSLQY